jgi:hypothetical protein
MKLMCLAVLPALLACASCAPSSPGSVAQEEASAHVPTSPRGGSSGDRWLRGSVDERFAQVAKHLRGFDMAMVETGHRYGELYLNVA